MDDELSPFKKFVESDIKDVFINFAEFASWHVINGEKVLCVIDTDLTQKYGSAREDFQRYGVMDNQIRVFVHVPDLVPAPVQGQLLTVEDGVLVVLATAVNEGLTLDFRTQKEFVCCLNLCLAWPTGRCH